MSNMQNVDRILRNAENNFISGHFTEAKKFYNEALSILKTMGTEVQPTINFVNNQIANCDLPDNKEKERIMKEKKKKLEQEFGGDSGGFGGLIMSGLINSFLPKIQDAIVKNRPKLIQYFKGELTTDFQPIPEDQTPKRRIVIIELAEHESGNPDLADVIVQIRTEELTQVNLAVDEEGKDMGLQVSYSAVDFANKIVSGNIEEMLKGA